MTDATTPNYGWSYPTNGADSSTWGNTLNATVVAIDEQMAANAAAAGVPASGGAFTGPVAFQGVVRFSIPPRFTASVGGDQGAFIWYADSGNASGKTTVSTSGPTGTPANGDRWLQYTP